MMLKMNSNKTIEDKIEQLINKKLLNKVPRARIGSMETLGTIIPILLTHGSKERIVYIPENRFVELFDNERKISWESYFFNKNIFPIPFTKLNDYVPLENSRKESEIRYIRDRSNKPRGVIMPLTLGIERVYDKLLSE